MDQTNLLAAYASALKAMTSAELEREIAKPDRLLIQTEGGGSRKIDVAYAPFDHVNMDARIVLVGLTPGRQQMRNALMEARRLLVGGANNQAAAEGAKVHASFSGPMRSNLVALLDCIGVSRLLGIESTASLWREHADLVQFTSALRYPVFVGGENYSGTPSMMTTPVLRQQLLRWFAAELAMLPNAVFVPLGPKVTEGVELAAREFGLDLSRVLSGLPHPSGANAERIAFFLGRKERAVLSNKVDPKRLQQARDLLTAKVATLV